MAGPRFRVVMGKMLIVTPENESEWRDVKVFYDTENKCLGIQLVGESELKGYIFEVPVKTFKAAMDQGTPVQELRIS